MRRPRSCRAGANDLGTEDKVDRADQAQAGPEVIELERLVHVEHRERHEHGQCDRLLHDLQLRQAELGVADAVGRHLQQYMQVNYWQACLVSFVKMDKVYMENALDTLF